MRVRSFIALVTCLTFTAMVAWPQRASAQEAAPAAAAPASDDQAMAQAKQHFEAGRAAYNAGDYAGSIREFKQAETLRPSPILDYNIGLANEKLGKRRVAVKYYRKYLELQPNAANKDEVNGRISALDAAIAQQPSAAAQAQPGGTAPQGQPGQAEEQASDMPPPDTSVQPGQTAQAGYDPYASPAPGGPQAVKPKKRSLWWIWLIVGGAVLLTTLIIVAAVVVADSPSTTTNTGFNLKVNGTSLDRQQTPAFNGATLFRF
jgi:tetratricopeptide (TPR) repeat protein